MEMNLIPSASLLIYFKEYENFHHTRGNKITHMMGIPLVLFSLVGLLAHVVLWGGHDFTGVRLDLGNLLVLAGALFSIRVDYKLGIPFTLFALLNYLIARHLTYPVLGGLQVLGWIAQLVGHWVYEKKSPAFFTSMEHLFVGPMWLFAWLIQYYRPTP